MSRKLKPLSYRQFLQEMNVAVSSFERKKKMLERRLKAFQETCEHKKTTFNCDPSGGSDSCYTCDLCDKVVS